MTRTIRRSAHALVFALLVVVAATRAEAISLSMDPAASVIAVGDSVEIALNVSGLVDGAAPSLGLYDIDVAWDPSILFLSVVAIGDPLLGDQLDLGGLGTVTTIAFGAGTVSVFELSLDTIVDLDTLQAGSFTLATLTFQLLAAGTSSITPSVVQVADANGRPLELESVTGAEVSVSAVPEPSGAVLYLAGLLLVHSRTRRVAPRLA